MDLEVLVIKLKIMILQPYKDWLLLNRGEIRPEIGDIVKYNLKNAKVKLVYSNNKYVDFYEHTSANIEDCYVEIVYNPNEVIDFANWLFKQEKYNYANEELLKEFRNEKET